MKYTILIAVMAAFAFGLTLQASAADAGAKDGKKVLFHVVCFKFKPDASKEQIAYVEKAFMGLKAKIPAIQSLTWGTNNSPEKLAKGFTHCFVLTFADEKARDEYLPHPDHKAFGKSLGPILGDVFVIDFWGEK